MSAQGAVIRGRRKAESLMVDACTITRLTGAPGELNPDTGLRDPAPTVTVYSGRCKVQTYEAHESTPQSGQHVWSVQRYYVHIPVGVEIRVDDTVTVTASVLDENLVGRTYRVAGLLHKSMATANRLIVDEVTR